MVCVFTYYIAKDIQVYGDTQNVTYIQHSSHQRVQTEVICGHHKKDKCRCSIVYCTIQTKTSRQSNQKIIFTHTKSAKYTKSQKVTNSQSPKKCWGLQNTVSAQLNSGKTQVKERHVHPSAALQSNGKPLRTTPIWPAMFTKYVHIKLFNEYIFKFTARYSGGFQ